MARRRNCSERMRYPETIGSAGPVKIQIDNEVQAQEYDAQRADKMRRITRSVV